jgi:hypothetical protein
VTAIDLERVVSDRDRAARRIRRRGSLDRLAARVVSGRPGLMWRR